jgi:hypothetical protein
VVVQVSADIEVEVLTSATSGTAKTDQWRGRQVMDRTTPRQQEGLPFAWPKSVASTVRKEGQPSKPATASLGPMPVDPFQSVK